MLSSPRRYDLDRVAIFVAFRRGRDTGLLAFRDRARTLRACQPYERHPPRGLVILLARLTYR